MIDRVLDTLLEIIVCFTLPYNTYSNSNGETGSSNINEVIRAVLNCLLSFYEKILHTQKAQKSIKSTKNKKLPKAPKHKKAQKGQKAQKRK